MSKLSKCKIYYEELKENKVMATKSIEKKPKVTLTVFTYLNFKRFGLSVAIDDGIKINILWFETHIKFERR